MTLLGAALWEPDKSCCFFTTLQQSSLSSTRASLLEMRNIRAVQVNRQHDALCLRAPEVASVRRVADMRMVLLVVIEEVFVGGMVALGEAAAITRRDSSTLTPQAEANLSLRTSCI